MRIIAGKMGEGVSDMMEDIWVGVWACNSRGGFFGVFFLEISFLLILFWFVLLFQQLSFVRFLCFVCTIVALVNVFVLVIVVSACYCCLCCCCCQYCRCCSVSSVIVTSRGERVLRGMGIQYSRINI